jgi:hypothetical protein
MVSPIPNWPLWAKLGLSAATLVLMVAYLTGGIQWRRSTPVDEPAPAAPDGKPLLALTNH